MLKKPALLYEYTFGTITDLKSKGNNCVVILTVIALKEKANRDGSQPIPRDSNDKDMAAMLDELTIEADEESFVIVHQHGGNDVTCKRSIRKD